MAAKYHAHFAYKIRNLTVRWMAKQNGLYLNGDIFIA
jgi:hypothetical protein